jgi:hypothetical protein
MVWAGCREGVLSLVIAAAGVIGAKSPGTPYLLMLANMGHQPYRFHQITQLDKWQIHP